MTCDVEIKKLRAEIEHLRDECDRLQFERDDAYNLFGAENNQLRLALLEILELDEHEPEDDDYMLLLKSASRYVGRVREIASAAREHATATAAYAREASK